ncbi:tRNA (guanine(26)-N(2))-dimethyltransferase, partial [Zancudomyces culisetae]
MGACPPIIKVTSAICNAGYKVSCSHTCPGSIKTDAPDYVIWDIVRELAKTCGSKQVDPENREQQYIGNIINKPQTVTNVDFTYNANAVGESRKIKLVRYQVNPTKNWGPKK